MNLKKMKWLRVSGLSVVMLLLMIALTACPPDPAGGDIVLVSAIEITAPNDVFTISTSGGTLQLSASITPAEATDSSVTWSITAGSTLATISSTGLVTAQADGTVTVKATAADASGISVTKDIVISNNTSIILVTAIQISAPGDAFTISAAGGTLQLSASATPADATDTSVTWSITAGSSLATISSTGLVTAQANGTVTVKATAADASGISAVKDIVITNNNATLNLMIAEDSTDLVSATQPVIYQMAADMTFITILANGSITSGEGSLATQTISLPAGSYFIRAFHDLDNDGSPDGNEYMIYAADESAASAWPRSFVPKSFNLTSGASQDATLDLDNALLPTGWCMVAIAASYTGSQSTISMAHPLMLGCDDIATFANNHGTGISIYQNNVSAYIIIPAGTWYFGGFLDVNGNFATVSYPDSGDPAEAYNNKQFGVGSPDPVVISSGQIQNITFNLDDTWITD